MTARTTDHDAPVLPAPCENCHTVLLGGYCHVCGQRAHSPLQHFGHAVEEVFESFWHLDGRIFRTLRDLCVPGRVAAAYLAGHRVRYLAPLRLFVILSLLTFFVGKLTLHFDPGNAVKVDAAPSRSGVVIGETRLDDDPFAGAKSAADVLARHAKILREIDAENAGTGVFLSTILDVAKDDIDAQARARMTALGATPAQWRALEAARAASAPKPGAASSAPEQSVVTGDGVLQRWLRARIERIQENVPRVRDDPDELLRSFLGALPGALFVLVPLFALCLKLLYIRSGRGYLEHLVVALYSHAFMLTALLLVFLLLGVQTIAGLPVWAANTVGVVAGIVLNLCVPLYLLWMQKRVYAQGWVKTLIKYATLGPVYSFLLTLTIVYAVLAGLSS
jgi:hypothetical protein